MRADDSAMSELMGYTVLVAVVSIAAVGLLAGSMSSASAVEKRMELSGSAYSLKSFAGMADSAIGENNTYYAACAMGIPSGYELIVLDRHDDFRSISIYSGSNMLTYLPSGSVSVRSPFRSASFEGGAVLSNDSGLAAMEKSPAVYVMDLGSGKKALYVSIASVSCDSSVLRGSAATIYAKCSSVKPMRWDVADGSAIALRVRSGEPEAWGEYLERCGFNVSYEDGEAVATIGEVSYVYAAYAEVGVKVEGG